MTSAFDLFRKGRFLGFDSLFDQLDTFIETATSKVTFPPYNIAKLTEHAYQLQFALAGFSKDEIRVRQQGDYLVVEGTLSERNTGPQLLHQGISAKNFLVKFMLADGVMVEDVAFDNGMLSVSVQKPIEGVKSLDFKIRTPLPKTTISDVEQNIENRRTEIQPRSDMMEALEDDMANKPYPFEDDGQNY